MSKQLIESAVNYAANGIPVFPCNSDKSPLIKKKDGGNGWKDASVSEEWIRLNFENAKMIGVPTGDIICLDIDAKHKAGLVADFEFCCDQMGLTDLLVSMPKQLTPSGGGAHYLFRTTEEIRNLKLARNAEKETIIETRGAGGYICVYPSRGYKFDRGGLLSVPELSTEQVDALFDVARSFNEVAEHQKFEGGTPWKAAQSDGNQPGDHYNDRGDIVELLQRHGWTTRTGSHWTRPGKAHGVSATLGKVEGKFYVFSSNASPFESETSYSPFACYAILEHGGDFSAATKQLREDGYGGESEVPDVSPEFKRVIDNMLANERARKANSWMEVGEEIKQAAAESVAIEDKKPTPLSVLMGMVASDPEHIADMQERAQEAQFILPDIALRGDWTIIFAQRNAGKTLLTLWLLAHRKKEENQKIFYVNCDDSFNGGIEKMIITQGDIKTLIPNERGFDHREFNKILLSLVQSGEAKECIFVLDTLKKFADPMSKTEAREFGMVVRAFTQAGGTVICLAHINKAKNADGKSVAEGVGDFGNDCDCVYLMEMTSPKDSDERVLTFENDKLRGPNVKKVSYTYDNTERKSWHHRYNSVKKMDAEAAKARAELEMMEQQLDEDQPVIDYIVSQLRDVGPQPKSALIRNNLGGDSGSATQRTKVLERYGPGGPVRKYQLWGESRGQNGGWNMYLLSDSEKEPKGNLVNFL